jgi:hypothetical protein
MEATTGPIENNPHSLSIDCSLETMYFMFPPEKKEETGIYALDWLIEHYGPKERSMVERWVDFEAPRLIDTGIKRGYWEK